MVGLPEWDFVMAEGWVLGVNNKAQLELWSGKLSPLPQ